MFEHLPDNGFSWYWYAAFLQIGLIVKSPRSGGVILLTFTLPETKKEFIEFNEEV